MSSALISPATKTEFREVLSSYVLREIGDIFSRRGISTKPASSSLPLGVNAGLW